MSRSRTRKPTWDHTCMHKNLFAILASFFFLEKKNYTSLVSILFSSLTECLYKFHARWLQCVTVRLLALLTFWELIGSCLKGRVAGTLVRAFTHVLRHIYCIYSNSLMRRHMHTHMKKCAEHAVTAAGNVTCKDQMSDKEPCLCVCLCVSLASQGRGIKALQSPVAERKIATQWGWTHTIWLDYNLNISATNAEHGILRSST